MKRSPKIVAWYRYLNPLHALHTSGSILQQTNSWRAWILIALAILWSWVLNLSPIVIGIYVAVKAHSFWPALWVPLLIYLIYGIYLAFWPILAFFSFISVWYTEGFLAALLSTILGILLLFVFFGAPEWLMFLAYRYAEKAARFGEVSSVATVAATVDDAALPDTSGFEALEGSGTGKNPMDSVPAGKPAQAVTGPIPGPMPGAATPAETGSDKEAVVRQLLELIESDPELGEKIADVIEAHYKEQPGR